MFRVNYTPDPADDIVLEDPRWEAPSLLIPGRKPTGPVVVDTEHELAVGLQGIFCEKGEVVSGSPLVMRSGGPVKVNSGGQCLDSTVATSNDTAQYAAAPRLNIKNDFTLFFIASNLYTNSGNIFGVTQDSQGYRGVCINVSSTTWPANLRIRVFFNGGNDTTNDTAISGASYPIPDDGVHGYIITRSGSNVIFYKADSGVDVGATDTGFNSSDLAGPLSPVMHCQEYSEGNIGGGSGLGLINVAMVWNRVLTEPERVSITADPYQFLIPA